MKLSTLTAPGLVAGMLLSSAVAAETAVIIKTGQFTLSKDSQVILNEPLQFDDSSTGVFGAELEWRMKDGISLGGEVTLYQNDWVSTLSPLNSGAVDTVIVMFNAKKYFAVSEIVHPYVGAGVGVAVTDFSGAITGNSSGLAIQAVGGIEFRWDKFGLYTELKALSADTEDDLNEEVDVSGTGVFVGLSIFF
jgi:opacity protein-like surface antigen